MADLDLTVTVEDDAWVGALPKPDALCEAAVRAALGEVGIDHACELSIALTGNDRVQDLNREWRDKDKPTNVLSFPAGDDPDAAQAQGRPEMLGDIVLAFGVTRDEATEQGLEFEHHVTHLVVHGVLHLLGYDHIEDDDAEEMETLESTILKGLGLRDPYGDE